MKLIDVIVTPLGSVDPRLGISIRGRPATVVNKVPTSSPICDHCDILPVCRARFYPELACGPTIPERNKGKGLLLQARISGMS
jgi:hypothetical protein